MTTTDVPPCLTCGNTSEWHDANPHTMHPFNDGTVAFRQSFGRSAKERKEEAQAKPQVPTAYPIDPVLRQALVDAGVITPEQLDTARRKIEDMTQVFGRGFGE